MNIHKLKEVDQATYAFPASVIGHWLPLERDIPKDFPQKNDWDALFSKLFFGPFDQDLILMVKPDVPAQKAWRIINAVMRSYEPRHKHKALGVAYMLSEFFANYVWVDAKDPAKPQVHFKEVGSDD